MDSVILNALEKDEDISEETDQALTFQDDIHYWILKIKEFVTDEYHPVSTFQTKRTPRVPINLPKLHIQPFGGNPLEWLEALSLNDCLHTGPNLTQRLQNVSHLQITQDSLHGRYRKGVPTNRARHSRQGCYKIRLARRCRQISDRFCRVLF